MCSIPLCAYLLTDEILNLFSNKMFSENGSPQLQKERISYTFFRDLLYEIEGMWHAIKPAKHKYHSLGGELDVVLSEVLGFFTGAGRGSSRQLSHSIQRIHIQLPLPVDYL